MSMLEELWIGGLDYQGRPVKKGSAMEHKMYLYAKNAEKMKGMLTGPQAEQYEKTIDAFNDVLGQSEELFELHLAEFVAQPAALLLVVLFLFFLLDHLDDQIVLGVDAQVEVFLGEAGTQRRSS